MPAGELERPEGHAMAPRNLKMLMFDRETSATIRSALDTLDEIEPPISVEWAEKIAAQRHDLLIELDTIEGGLSTEAQQGRLF